MRGRCSSWNKSRHKYRWDWTTCPAVFPAAVGRKTREAAQGKEEKVGDVSLTSSEKFDLRKKKNFNMNSNSYDFPIFWFKNTSSKIKRQNGFKCLHTHTPTHTVWCFVNTLVSFLLFRPHSRVIKSAEHQHQHQVHCKHWSTPLLHSRCWFECVCVCETKGFYPENKMVHIHTHTSAHINLSV